MVCDSNALDCQTKMDKVPYLCPRRLSWGIKMDNVNDFDCAFTSYKKNNTKPDLVAGTDHFVIHFDVMWNFIFNKIFNKLLLIFWK